MRRILVLAFSVSSLVALAPASARELTFEDRVAAQRAIEQVYWNHRIWPKENPGPKPPLSEVMPDEAVRAKVEDYLKKSNALEKLWERPITAEQLQAEMDRMARDTHDGATLQELYDALGNDPFLIAEALVRPALADRRLHNWYANDERFHGALKKKAEAALAACGRVDCMKSMGGDYREMTSRLRSAGADATVKNPGEDVLLDADAWQDRVARLSGALGGAPGALPTRRVSHLEETAEAFVVTAVLSQRAGEITTATVVWPKSSFDEWWSVERGMLGTRVEATSYPFASVPPLVPTCDDDTWYPTSTDTNVPAARAGHIAVWTGVEMIVWGGWDGGGTLFNSGGRYNPSTDSWVATSTTGAPVARFSSTAVWTGHKMIVWGGSQVSGGEYDPSKDRWDVVPGPPFVSTVHHTAVWTGTEMIVWGYVEVTFGTNGGRYDPSTDSWAGMVTNGAPAARSGNSAVWTGTEMIVWGGFTESGRTNTGGRYDPSSVSFPWHDTSTDTNVPAARSDHSAVWTGTEMIVWGGEPAYLRGLQSGGRYDPSTDTWTTTSTGSCVPSRRWNQTGVWTGTEMIVWGGQYETGPPPMTGDLGSGGRYDPLTDAWDCILYLDGPTARSNHSAVWTGNAMIVWGGSEPETNTGGSYCACPNGTLIYRDADGDGYGDRTVATPSCDGSAPAGYVAYGGDCNDASAEINPGAYEVCNGLDDNCDGTTDNGGSALCSDDGNPCTRANCSGTGGCVQSPNFLTCNDNNLCTTNDWCTNEGACVGTPVPEGDFCPGLPDQPHACIDRPVCRSGACTYNCSPTGTPCDDGLACTAGDYCDAGSCRGTPTYSSLPRNLVSWWPGDKGTVPGTTATDVRGGNDGTLMNGVPLATGMVGSAFSFDGATNWIEVGDRPGLEPPALSSLTLMAWVRKEGPSVDPYPEDPIIFGKAPLEGPGYDEYFLRWVNGGGVNFTTCGSAACYGLVTTTPMGDGQWYHVAGTLDGSTGVKRIYLNGNLDNTGPSAAVLAGSHPWRIGRGSNPGVPGVQGHFNGRIDEPQVYSRALSAFEIRDLYDMGAQGCSPIPTCSTRASGLVSWWPGDQDASDIQGANHGTLTNGATFAAGRVGAAFRLDGVDDYVGNLGTAASFSFIQNTGVFTIDAWIKFDDVSALVQQAITANSIGAGAKGHYFIWENSAGQRQLSLQLARGQAGVPIIQSASPTQVITTNGWHHVAAVGNGTAIIFYVDGVAYAGTGTMGTPKSTGDSTGVLLIGRCPHATPQCQFKGTIDEVQIYNRALAAAEIQTIYDVGRSGVCKCTDTDGDGYGAEGELSCRKGPARDCNDAGGTVWFAALPVTNLTVAGRSPSVVSWDSQASAVGAGTVYDLVSGSILALRTTGFSGASCLRPGGGTTYNDTRANPTRGDGYWYLSRARNSCGTGTYGSARRDTEIPPCP